jgi:hypothetical protein
MEVVGRITHTRGNERHAARTAGFLSEAYELGRRIGQFFPRPLGSNRPLGGPNAVQGGADDPAGIARPFTAGIESGDPEALPVGTAGNPHRRRGARLPHRSSWPLG